MFNPKDPYWVPRFPSGSSAERFIKWQGIFIDVGAIKDCQQLHRDVKETLPFQINYQLRKPANFVKPYALDAYGNMIPSSLYE